MGGDKFAGFTRRDLAYSHVNGHDIMATVLISQMPPTTVAVKRPIMVHWHGGGMILGHRMYAQWWPKWCLEFALSQNAIIISPDYRLLPEATGTDILDDIEAFCTWVQSELSCIAARESWEALPDPKRILCTGSSSGAWMAVQSAFGIMSSTDMEVRAIISISGSLDSGSNMKNTILGRRAFLGTMPPAPRQAEALIRQYIRDMRPGAVRTQGDPADMWELLLCVYQQGWIPRLMGVKSNPRLDLTATLSELERTLPPIWVIHGEEDSVVPVEASSKFVEAVKSSQPAAQVLFTLQPGDHDFSSEYTVDNTPWIQEGCQFIRHFW